METKKRGGARVGAGRKSLMGPTTVMRVPAVLKDALADFILATSKAIPDPPDAYRPDPNSPIIKLPLFSDRVPAGFPSPATDYTERILDLNELLINHPAATFLVRSTGQSMIGAGIHEGDLLIVDRSLNASNGSIVIAWVDNEFTVKRLNRQGSKVKLVAENPEYPDILFKDGQELQIWGVVTSVIHRFV